MSVRLKVLISAYACEHGRGSEPEVGWQWSMQMARFHDVTVVTRANNKANIEAALAALPDDHPMPQFVYFDGGKRLLWWKAMLKTNRLYYIWWQKAVNKLVESLCRQENYDLLHHVTIAGYRYTTAIWGHGVPCIWGPVGGMQSMDYRFLPYGHPHELMTEIIRRLNNLIQDFPTSAFPTRAKRSNLTIVSTKEPRQILQNKVISSVLMPTIGLQIDEFPERSYYDCDRKRPLRFLFVGQLIWLKGVDLAAETLAAVGTEATLHYIGSGPFESKIRKLVKYHDLEKRVTFSPRIPRAQVIRELYHYDVFLYPSLHDSGGFAVIEAMAAGMPVICLDVGGPAISVEEGCGFRIPVGCRSRVIAELAEKCRYYDANREMVAAHGKKARTQVLDNYNWDRKGEQMNDLYLHVAAHSG